MGFPLPATSEPYNRGQNRYIYDTQSTTELLRLKSDPESREIMGRRGIENSRRLQFLAEPRHPAGFPKHKFPCRFLGHTELAELHCSQWLHTTRATVLIGKGRENVLYRLIRPRLDSQVV